MTVRNIRAYQARGLLPPPVVDGRVGYYTEVHRERLGMIRRLRSEGFNLVAISALLTGVVPVTTPVASPATTQVTPAATGSPSGVSLVEDRARREAHAGAALLALGVPLDAVLALNREVDRSVEEIAKAYARLNDEYVKGPWLAVGAPEATRPRVNEAAAALPGIAVSAVTEALVEAVRKALEHSTVQVLERPQR
jgi:DNA-binding transcriptional MerR regulator